MFNKQATSTATATDNSRSIFSLSRRVNRPIAKGYRKASALLEFGARFTGAEDMSPVMEETLRALVRDTGGDLGYLMLLDGDSDTLTADLAISIGEKRDFPQTRRLGEGVEGFVASTAEPVVDSRRGRQPSRFIFDGESIVCVPLLRTNADGSLSEVCGTLTVISFRPRNAFDERDLEIARSMAALSVVTLANEKRYRNLRGSFLKSLQAMARAIESKVPFMEGHGDRVAQVCVELGMRLGLTDDVLQDLRAGAQLHEIGKIGIPDTILLKPGQLTPEEFTSLKQYPVIGYEMCKPLGLGEQVLTLIRNHPERLDGTGYPDKLKYGELPLPLRILCVADAFDAMSSYRPYRQVMDKRARHEQLNRFAGTQFDPIIVETLKGLLADGRLESLYQEHWAKYANIPSTSEEQQPVLVREQQPGATPSPSLKGGEKEPETSPLPSPWKGEGEEGREEEAETSPRTSPWKGEGEEPAPRIYLADVGDTPAPIVNPIRDVEAPAMMLNGEPLMESTSPPAPLFQKGEPLSTEILGEDPSALVAEALSSIGAATSPASTPPVEASVGPVERKLTLEEAAMEAAEFAAAALEAANREDKAA